MVPQQLSAPERVRVASVITRMNVGGPALQLLLVGERLDPVRFEAHLITGSLDRGEADMLPLRRPKLAPMVVRQLGRRIDPLADVVALVRLVAIFRKLRPHVVHTHLSKGGALGRVAARIAGVPVVLHTYHGTVFRGYFPTVASRIILLVERALAMVTTRIIAISPTQRRDIERLGIARTDRVVEVPYGLELDTFRDAAPGRLRAELLLEPDVPLVGIVARLVPIKGIDVFLNACALVARARPDVRFLVIGDGESSESLRTLASHLALERSLRFLGWRSDLPSIYADLDVVALTSHNEGTPLSLIEALAAGRAIVATAVGGVPDVIGSPEVGVLVPDGDHRAVADAILRLIEDPTRRRELGASGRARVYDTYEISQHVGRLSGLYDQLLGRPALSSEERRLS